MTNTQFEERDDEDWPEELSEPRADQMTRFTFRNHDDCRCLVGWAQHDFGHEHRVALPEGRRKAFARFILVLLEVAKEHTGSRRASVPSINDHVLKTNRERAMIYRRAAIRCGYTEVVA